MSKYYSPQRLKKLKQRVSLEAVLRHYHVLETKVKSGQSWRGECPFCESGSPFSAHFGKNAWKCFSSECQEAERQGNTLDFVGFMEDLKVPQEVAPFLEDLFPIGNPSLENQKKQTTPKPEPRPSEPSAEPKPEPPNPGPPAEQEEKEKPEATKEEPKTAPPRETAPATLPKENPPLPFELQGIDYEHELVGKLGLSERATMTYRVGFYGGKGKTFRNRLVFPIQNAEGDLAAYGSPSLEEPGAIDYPPKFHPEREVYNLDARHAVGELVLVESPLDVFALMDAGYYAVAFMGTKLAEHQVDLLRRRFSPDTLQITLLLSADYPHTAEALALLLPHCFIRLRRYPPKKGSFTSFTAEEAHALLSDSP